MHENNIIIYLEYFNVFNKSYNIVPLLKHETQFNKISYLSVWRNVFDYIG